MPRYLPSLLILVASLFASGVTTAQARPDTWVAPNGSDAGTCVSTAPCRTFAYAYTQTSVNGSINVAAPGSYGPLTISKAISIVADGVQAAILTAAGGAAIKVQAPGAIVSLSGLTIDMRGSANDGISFVSGAALHVHRSVIRKAGVGSASRQPPEISSSTSRIRQLPMAWALTRPVSMFDRQEMRPSRR